VGILKYLFLKAVSKYHLDALSFVSLIFLTVIRCKACIHFLFYMVCASVVSDLPSLFEAGYSVSPNIEA